MKDNNIFYGEINDLNLKAIIGLSRATNKSEKNLNNLCRDYGITIMQFSVLEFLYHKGEHKIGEIIKKILSTGGNMTVVINNLERNGYIKKCISPLDSRATIIKITDSGKSLIEDIFPKHLEGLNEFFSRVTEEEKETLINILKKLGD